LTPEQGQRIRLVFELTRADHPRLYEDLIRFSKGTKRINRLRVLAYDGLLLQHGALRPADLAPQSQPRAAGGEQGGAASPLTNGLFGPGVPE
jgi:hypothetical protein